MDEIWEARQKRVDRFCRENDIDKKTAGDIKKIVYDSLYGEIGYISPFTSVLPDGTKMSEWP